jgi:hypothetical protein
MRLLTCIEQRGDITGIKIQGKQTMLQQLFADGMGLFLQSNQANFAAAQRLVEMYQRISGAKISLEKLFMLSFGSEVVPDWFARRGCQVAQPKTVYKYLGFLIGIGLSTEDELNFMLEKVRRKHRHWSNRLLTMAGKAVYVKHVLRSVPIYNLVLFDYSKDGFRGLEKQSREFIWGLSAEGRAKVSLIVWEKIIKPKIHGGLDLHPLREQAILLKIRNVSKIMADGATEWIWMAKDLIRRGLKSGENKMETTKWSAQEFLLLNPKVSIASKTLRYVLEGWKLVREQLKVRLTDSQIPGELLV